MAGTRVGRRERPRTGYGRRPFWERFRGPIIVAAVVAAVALVGAFMAGQAGAKTYICTTVWDPTPRPSPADPGASPDYGLIQPDMGNNHGPSVPQRYTYCPPASGTHYNLSGRGPIEARFYGRDDYVEPQGWIHNLEHGSLVILYRGQQGDPGLTNEMQQRMRAYWPNVPRSPVCGFAPGTDQKVIIARFDEMAWPFAALVWGRVLPLESWDTEQIEAFWATEGERTNPEQRCPRPSPTPGPGSPSPSASAPPTNGSPAPTGSPAASPAAS